MKAFNKFLYFWKGIALTVLSSVILLLAGCDSNLSPPTPSVPDDVIVTSVLRSDLDRQGVLVTDVVAPDQSQIPIRLDAEVQINDISFPALPPESLRINLSGPRSVERDVSHTSTTLSLVGGRMYELTVDVDGESVVGRLQMPGLIETGFVDGYRIFWARSAGAAEYVLTISYAGSEEGGWVRQDFSTSDTSFVVVPDAEFIPGRHLIRVEALDSNLAAARRGIDGAGIMEGSRGTFGATSVLEGFAPITDSTSNKSFVMLNEK